MANTKGSDNPFPSVLFAEHVDPPNPSAGFQRLFVDTDHLLKLRDSSGTVTTYPTTAGGTGTLTTVEEVDGTPTDSAVTKLVFPNGTLAIASHVATYTPAAAASAELDYAQITSDASITATSAATANTVITGASVSYDGSTTVMVSFTCYGIECPSSQQLIVNLYDGSTDLGFLAQYTNAGSGTERWGATLRRRLTPSNASHQYSIRAWVTGGTGKILAAAGGTGTGLPAFMHIARV